MLAAAFAWVFVARASPRHRLLVALSSAAIFGLALVLSSADWSFVNEAADELAPPVFLFVAALGTAAVIVGVRRPLGSWLLGALGALCFATWGLLAFSRALESGPPDFRAPLSDGYRYEVAVTGWAFTSDFVGTRIFRTSLWLPVFERRVVQSVVRGPEGGLVSDVSAIEVEVDTSGAQRQLVVYYAGSELDRTPY